MSCSLHGPECKVFPPDEHNRYERHYVPIKLSREILERSRADRGAFFVPRHQEVLAQFRKVLAVIAWAAQWCPRDPSHRRHEGAFFDLVCRETTALLDEVEDWLAFEAFRC